MASDTLYVFGDQSADALPSIRRLTQQSRQCSALRDFMRTATDSIQQAVDAVPTHLRPCVSRFDSPLQLAESIDGTAKSTPIVSSLLAIAQLGGAIVHLSSQPCALDTSHSAPAFLSVCTGSLAAAAVASSRNLTELLQVASPIVVIAFHIGLEAFKRSQNLEKSDQSWATVVKDANLEDVRAAIDDFNQTLDDSHHRRVYISAIGEASVTISGPPSVTERFFTETNSIEGTKRLQLPIKAAFHARHLFPVPHSRIFRHVSRRCLQRPLRHPMISPCSGSQYFSSNLLDLLHEILDEILQQPINWQTATANLSNLLAPSATMVPMGPSYATSTLSNWLPSRAESERKCQQPETNSSTSRGGSGAVAIVGMAMRLPGSEKLEDFWEVLETGKELHSEIPQDRFDTDTYADRMGTTKDTVQTPFGVFLDRPGFFDPRFFNMSPREALQTDPQQRLLLLTTYEALEDAGYSPNRTPSTNTRRIASFVGQTGDDYREMNASQNIDTYFITGGIRAFAPGRLNYHFGWEGPSYSVDTACSSSAASIQLACSTLLSRECDMAVGGGANLLTSPDLFAGLSKGGFLSKTGSCKTFDQAADGYVRGEGCGVVILKRLEDALAERDNILAVIRGSATNHSADAISITHPHSETQQRLFKSVLDEAGVLPHEVDLAEMHGTGTQAGDLTESESVTKVLCQGRSSEHPLILSTVKPNVGHGEAASGVTSIAKAILMLQKNTVPPHVGIKTSLNQKLEALKSTRVRICLEKTPFSPRAGGDGKRRILINNFDAAGGNTSMLLEDPPMLSLEGEDVRTHHVVALSARSAKGLDCNTQSLLQWLRQNPQARIEDLAYTTTSRRIHYRYRKAYSVNSHEQLVAALEKPNSSETAWSRVSEKPKCVFCFTGQGSQYLSMASVLYTTHSTFRDSIEDYDSICVSHGFPSFLPIIEGDSKALESPIQTQLATIAIELALTQLWKCWGLEASAVVGHSLGEYSALCYANVISASDCLYLVGKRAELLEQRCKARTHAMLAIQASSDDIQKMLRKEKAHKSEVTCRNSPQSNVAGGPVHEIQRLDAALKTKNIKAKLLSTPYAFHSSQVDDILDDFEAIAQKIHFARPCVPVSSTTIGEIITTEESFNPKYLRRQTRGCVKFQKAVEALHSESLVDGQTLWMEIGPNPTCLNMVKAAVPGTRLAMPSLQSGRDDWQVTSLAVAAAYNAGFTINWSEFHRPYEQSLQMLQLPNYSFDLKNYWMSYEGKPRVKMTGIADQTSNCSARSSFAPTTSLHRVEEEVVTNETTRVTFTSEACDPLLMKTLCGHLVNGVALCPSSVYADMAMTAALYVDKLDGTTTKRLVDIRQMEVSKPLIINPESDKQVIRVTACKQKHSNEVNLQYSSTNGSTHQTHATCMAVLDDGKDRAEGWSKNGYLVQSRIEHLHRASVGGSAHRLLRPMVYKLFKAFVDYDAEYQGLEEVHLNSGLLEAAANVRLRSSPGVFACNPRWIDSIAHLSGFVLNGSDFTPADSVFISHGWKSFKIVDSLSTEGNYSSYVRMQPSTGRGVYSGDVYMFEGDKIVAVCEELKFQQIKRSVLDHILPTTEMKPITLDHDTLRATSKPSQAYVESEHTDVKSRMIPQLSRNVESTKGQKVVQIIAKELGLDLSELDEDANFTDLGIDSLMTTSILATLKTDLNIILPASVFVEYCSVGELKAKFDRSTNITNGEASELPYRPAPVHDDAPKSDRRGDSIDLSFPQVLQMIAKEVGTEVSEFEDDTFFADLGVDSLLSISIITSLNHQLGQQIPASLFVQYPKVSDLRVYFEASYDAQCALFDESDEDESQSVSDDESTGHITPDTDFSDYEDETIKPPTRQPILGSALRKTLEGSLQLNPPGMVAATNADQWTASSILLQGSSLNREPCLFLIPDGSGSASSYVGLPLLKHRGAVYGLNSPFLAKPESFRISLQELVSLYVTEMRRIQPSGPYYIGGWSIGGICAFESAAKLIRDYGEVVKSLILIDAPCPTVLPPVPMEDVDFLQSKGVLDSLRCSRPSQNGTPTKTAAPAPAPALRHGVREHFAGSVNALKQYEARAIDEASAPESVIVLWARDGVWKSLGKDAKTKSAGHSKHQHPTTSWLMDSRPSSGGCGWEKLLPGSQFTCHTVHGDHFSIMKKPGVQEMGAKISSSLSRA